MPATEVVTILERLEQELPVWDRAACLPLLGLLERLKALAWVQILGSPVNTPDGREPDRLLPIPPDRYLTVSEVVARFNVTPKWLYRHKSQMPHSQPSRKVLLFPEQAITKWFASRKWA